MNLNNSNDVLLSLLRDTNLKSLSSREINFFKNKKVLITGVSGIIGINLLFFLDKLNKENKISVKVDGIYNTSIFAFVKKYFKKNKKINFFKLNLTKSNIPKSNRYDLIFHCAGYGQPSKFLKFKESTYRLNSSVILSLKKNLKSNAKFIYLSSTEIYSGNEFKCSEESVGKTNSTHPRSTYIDSKRFGESYIVNTFKNFVIFRACLIYGPGAKINDGRVLNQVIMRSIKNNKIDIYGGLNQLRSNLYISDAIILMSKILCKKNNEIYNLNNHKMIKLGKIFSMISKITKKKLVSHQSNIIGSPKIIKISNSKILQATKYKISVNEKEGITKTINWFENLIRKKMI